MQLQFYSQELIYLVNIDDFNRTKGAYIKYVGDWPEGFTNFSKKFS